MEIIHSALYKTSTNCEQLQKISASYVCVYTYYSDVDYLCLSTK